MKQALILAVLGPLAACAGLEFNAAPQPGALTYREAAPYVFVSVNKDCTWTATVLSLPGTERSVTFKNGYGTANLSIALTNGMISSAGQQTDSKIPETITALSGLATAAAGIRAVPGAPAPKAQVCAPEGHLYPVVNGAPDQAHGVTFPATLVPGP